MRARIMLRKASFLCLTSSCKSLDIVLGIFQFFFLFLYHLPFRSMFKQIVQTLILLFLLPQKSWRTRPSSVNRWCGTKGSPVKRRQLNVEHKQVKANLSTPDSGTGSSVNLQKQQTKLQNYFYPCILFFFLFLDCWTPFGITVHIYGTWG